MDTIIRLLTDYKTYVENGIPDDLALFGEWLKQKYTADQNYQTDEEEVNEAGLDVMAAYVLCGLTNYIETWIKLTYQDLPIISLGDFGIIKTIEFLGNPTKKMVADEVIMEHSTCIEAIKRLTKEGLLSEEIDQQDRRMKRVKLTPYGEEIVQTLNKKMTALGTLVMGNLNEIEKKALLPTLNKLLTFHDYLYHQKDRQEVKGLYGL